MGLRDYCCNGYVILRLILDGGLRTSLHIPIRIKFPASLSDALKTRGETMKQNEQGEGVMILGSPSPKMLMELIPAVAIAAQSEIVAGPSRCSRHIFNLKSCNVCSFANLTIATHWSPVFGLSPRLPMNKRIATSALCVPRRDQYVLRAFAWLSRLARNMMDGQEIVLKVLGATFAGY